jgi:hypothetical protein
LSELLVPQLLDRVFELLDQQRAVLRLALRCNQCRPLREDERMRTRKISWKRIIDAHRPAISKLRMIPRERSGGRAPNMNKYLPT